MDRCQPSGWTAGLPARRMVSQRPQSVEGQASEQGRPAPNNHHRHQPLAALALWLTGKRPSRAITQPVGLHPRSTTHPADFHHRGPAAAVPGRCCVQSGDKSGGNVSVIGACGPGAYAPAWHPAPLRERIKFTVFDGIVIAIYMLLTIKHLDAEGGDSSAALGSRGVSSNTDSPRAIAFATAFRRRTAAPSGTSCGNCASAATASALSEFAPGSARFSTASARSGGLLRPPRRLRLFYQLRDVRQRLHVHRPRLHRHQQHV